MKTTSSYPVSVKATARQQAHKSVNLLITYFLITGLSCRRVGVLCAFAVTKKKPCAVGKVSDFQLRHNGLKCEQWELNTRWRQD